MARIALWESECAAAERFEHDALKFAQRAEERRLLLVARFQASSDALSRGEGEDDALERARASFRQAEILRVVEERDASEEEVSGWGADLGEWRLMIWVIFDTPSVRCESYMFPSLLFS